MTAPIHLHTTALTLMMLQCYVLGKVLTTEVYIVNFSFFALYSLLLLSFFLYLKSVPIYT